MSKRQDAIAFYHDLCTSGSLAEDTWAHLLPGMRSRGLIFGERPLASVLRPLLHTGMDWHYLRWRSTLIVNAFTKMANDRESVIQFSRINNQHVRAISHLQQTFARIQMDLFQQARSENSAPAL